MLRPGVRLVERPGVLHFFDGRRVVSIRGDVDGRRALVTAADGPAAVGGHAVSQARDLLERLGLSTPAPGWTDHSDGAPSVAAAFASAAVAGGVSGSEAEQRLQRTQVHVWDDAGSGLQSSLSASGLRCQALPGPGRLGLLDPERTVVAVAAGDEQPLQALLQANQSCLAHGLTWLPVGAYDGAVLHVGPLMLPGQTACAECLLRRLAANVEYAGAYRDVASGPAAPTPTALRTWSHSVAALILLRWLANRDGWLPGRLFTVAPDELQIRSATVYRVPRCPVCAAPEFVTAAAPWDVARDH